MELIVYGRFIQSQKKEIAKENVITLERKINLRRFAICVVWEFHQQIFLGIVRVSILNEVDN